VIAARGEGALALLLVAGEREQDRRLEAGHLADEAGELAAVDVGKLEVEEDDLGPELARHLQALVAADRELDLVAHAAQQHGHGVCGIEIVVDD